MQGACPGYGPNNPDLYDRLTRTTNRFGQIRARDVKSVRLAGARDVKNVKLAMRPTTSPSLARRRPSSRASSAPETEFTPIGQRCVEVAALFDFAILAAPAERREAFQGTRIRIGCARA